MVVQPIALS